MKRTILLEVEGSLGNTKIEKEIDMILLGGLSGRNREEVQRHLRDLENYGIPTPIRIPVIMRVAVNLLTSETVIEVQGEKTSGEAEYVFFSHEERVVVTVGSDHSDNELEKTSSKRSKQVASKIICPKAWYYEDVRDHWDSLVLRSWISVDCRQELYQEDELRALLHIEDLRGLMEDRVGIPLDKALIFSGTIPTTAGIRASEVFTFELEDPVLGRKLTHGYKVESLPGYY